MTALFTERLFLDEQLYPNFRFIRSILKMYRINSSKQNYLNFKLPSDEVLSPGCSL